MTEADDFTTRFGPARSLVPPVSITTVDLARLLKAAKVVLLIHELDYSGDCSGWELVHKEMRDLFGTTSLNCLNDLSAFVRRYDV